MIWHDFMTNTRKGISKWTHYFPVYERHFSRLVNQSLVFWEIGVGGGGSINMWKRFFGPLATVIGIDINPDAANHEFRDLDIHVRIGNQSDTAFLQAVIDEFGVPDIVLDDGSHIMDDVLRTFSFVYPMLPKNGIYAVEDMHCAYHASYGGGLRKKGTFIEHCKDLIDELNAYYCGDSLEPTQFTNSTFSITFYDSVVVFEKIKRNSFKQVTSEKGA